MKKVDDHLTLIAYISTLVSTVYLGRIEKMALASCRYIGLIRQAMQALVISSNAAELLVRRTIETIFLLNKNVDSVFTVSQRLAADELTPSLDLTRDTLLAR
jgi:hypothetical protein